MKMERRRAQRCRPSLAPRTCTAEQDGAEEVAPLTSVFPRPCSRGSEECHASTALLPSASYTHQLSLPCYQTRHEYSQSSSDQPVCTFKVPLEIADLVLERKRSLSKVGASAQLSVPLVKYSCRHRTSHSNGTQAQGLTCKAILRPVFHPRHLTDMEDEERQRVKGSYHSVAGGFQVVSTCPCLKLEN